MSVGRDVVANKAKSNIRYRCGLANEGSRIEHDRLRKASTRCPDPRPQSLDRCMSITCNEKEKQEFGQSMFSVVYVMIALCVTFLRCSSTLVVHAEISCEVVIKYVVQIYQNVHSGHGVS